MTIEEANQLTDEAGKRLISARRALQEAASHDNDIAIKDAVKAWQAAKRAYIRTWKKVLPVYQ